MHTIFAIAVKILAVIGAISILAFVALLFFLWIANAPVENGAERDSGGEN